MAVVQLPHERQKRRSSPSQDDDTAYMLSSTPPLVEDGKVSAGREQDVDPGCFGEMRAPHGGEQAAPHQHTRHSQPPPHRCSPSPYPPYPVLHSPPFRFNFHQHEYLPHTVAASHSPHCPPPRLQNPHPCIPLTTPQTPGRPASSSYSSFSDHSLTSPALWERILLGDASLGLSLLRERLANGAELLDRDHLGRTAAHVAAAEGRPWELHFLLAVEKEARDRGTAIANGRCAFRRSLSLVICLCLRSLVICLCLRSLQVGCPVAGALARPVFSTSAAPCINLALSRAPAAH